MGFFNLFGNKKDTKEPTVFEKIKQAVRQTQENFTEKVQDLVVGRKEIDPDMLDELEAIMIGADVGVTTTNEILDSIRDQVSRKTLQDAAELRDAIKAEVSDYIKSRGEQLWQDMTDMARHNPMQAVAVGASIG